MAGTRIHKFKENRSFRDISNGFSNCKIEDVYYLLGDDTLTPDLSFQFSFIPKLRETTRLQSAGTGMADGDYNVGAKTVRRATQTSMNHVRL